MELTKPNDDFECLAASPEFARFSELLTKLTGVAMSLMSPRGEYRLGYGDGMRNPLCRIIRASAAGDARCHACDLAHNRVAGQRGKPLLYKCHAGFFDMIIPLFVQGRHVASLSSGQILAEAPCAAGFARMKKRLAWLNADPRALRNAYFAAVFMPKEKVRYMTSLLETFAGQLCESLHRIRELEARLERSELRRAKAYVAEHFADPDLGLTETATYAGLSPAHFSHVFKAGVGVSFTRHVRRVRLDAAKRLLSQTEASVSEVCFACGFNSLTHFIRVFRALEKTTPGAYRGARPTSGRS
jgi:AraC-like DNA-binding protein/ligand-binding sensor protein